MGLIASLHINQQIRSNQRHEPGYSNMGIFFGTILSYVLLLSGTVVFGQSSTLTNLAEEMSGTYRRLNSTSLRVTLDLMGTMFDPDYIKVPDRTILGEKCPNGLKMLIEGVSKKEMSLSLPFELVSSPGCNVSQLSSTHELGPQHEEYFTELLRDTVHCNDTYYGSLTIKSLRERLEGVVCRALLQLNVPGPVADAVLGREEKGYDELSPHWNNTKVNTIVRKAASFVDELSAFHVIEFGRALETPEPENLEDDIEDIFEESVRQIDTSGYCKRISTELRTRGRTCALMKGDETVFDTAASVMNKLVETLAPLLTHISERSKAKPPHGVFYPTSDCLQGIHNISLEAPTEKEAQLFKNERDRRFFLRINGAVCSDVTLRTVLETNYESKGDFDPTSVEFSHNLVEYIASSQRKQRSGPPSELRRIYPNVTDAILGTLIRYSLHAARLDLRNCFLDDEDEGKLPHSMDIIIARRSANYFLCNGFIPGSQSEECTGLPYELTAFIVRDETQCMFSSSSLVAEALREPQLSPEPTNDAVTSIL